MSWIWQGRQLVKAEKNKKLSFTYDSEGIRTSKTVGSTTTKYLLNGAQILAQTTNGITLSFFYDQQGNRVGMADSSNHFYYYIYNVQGDVIALADASTGKLVVTYTYDAWGKLVELKDTTANSVGTQNPFRYKGYYYDTETSLYYLQTRYYDPDTGRFINADAYATTDAGGVLSSNMFAYCENNPILRSDPTGEWVHILVGGILGGVSSLVDGLIDGKEGGQLIKSIVIGTISGALSAACPTPFTSKLVDVAATCIDSVSDMVFFNKCAKPSDIATTVSSAGFAVGYNEWGTYSTSKELSNDLKLVSSESAKIRPGQSPKVKKVADKLVDTTKKKIKRNAAKDAASWAGWTGLKNGFNWMLKHIF